MKKGSQFLTSSQLSPALRQVFTARWTGGKVDKWKGGQVDRRKGGQVERWTGAGLQGVGTSVRPIPRPSAH